MKKLIAAVLALTMMLALVACGNNNANNGQNNNDANVNQNETPNTDDAGNEGDETAARDLTKYYEDFMALLGEGNAPMMMPADPDTLTAFYPGLSDIATKQCVVQLAAMSAVAFEFALVECENSADVEAVKAILEARKAYQIDGGAWYPETIAAWEGAEIIVDGNVVALILAGEQTEAAVAFFNGEEVNIELPTVHEIDMQMYFDDFMATLGEENTPMMMPADPDTLAAFYPGLSDIATKQCVVQLAAMSAVAFEFALVECENAEDVETVKSIFEARKAYQVEGGAWYPETVAAWENAEIVVQGNFVALILAGEATADAFVAFNDLFAVAW